MRMIKGMTAKEYRHQYYVEHQEREHALSRQYCLSHRETLRTARRLNAKKHVVANREKCKRYYHANAVAENLRNKEYYKLHPDKKKAKDKRHYQRHKEQSRMYHVDYRHKNPEKMLTWRLRKHYKLTLEEYNILYKQQQGCCAICKKPFEKVPHIDHDHQTGKVRGLLCALCNLGLGFFRDRPSLLQEASQYLEAHETVSGEDS